MSETLINSFLGIPKSWNRTRITGGRSRETGHTPSGGEVDRHLLRGVLFIGTVRNGPGGGHQRPLR